MKKFMTMAAAALSVGLIAAPASAEVISFADFASGNEGGVQNGSIINFSGTNIGFSSGFNLNTGPGGWGSFTNSSGSDGPFFAYFDDLSGGKPGGLGVCRELNGAAGTVAPGAECKDAGDDSVDGDDGLNEVIAVFFSDGPFELRGLSFRDGQHNDINNSLGLVEYGINGAGIGGGSGVGGTTTFADLVARAIAGEFAGATSMVFGYVDTEFYIESISDVPIPGAIPLLLSGLAGLGFAARKKKAA